MDPRHVEQQVREAMRLDAAGQAPQAIAAYRAVLAREPNLPDCWYNLGVLLRRHGDFDAALAAYQQALERQVREPEEVHLNRAVIFADHLQRPDLAEQELQASLRCNPRYAPALFNLANLHEDLGRREAARELYERVLALKPLAHGALARLAGLHRADSTDDPLIARLEAALRDPRASAADRASLGFAAGKLLDDCDAYERAFAAIAQANRDSRASAPREIPPYDALAERRLIERLIAAFPAGQPCAPHQPRGDRPIFLCGMFRSGSTLAERVLAGHPAVHEGGELPLLPQLVARHLQPFPDAVVRLDAAQLTRLADAYLDALQRLFPDGLRVTDKRPDNFLYLGLIKRLLPQARIVHTVRHPLDVCLSIYFLHLDHRMNYAFDLGDIANHYRHYRRLMDHWRTLHGADILDFDYDTFVHHPRTQARRLLEFCGLDWDERCLDFAGRGGAVKTASVWQVREPLYQRSSGRWRHYETQLTEVRAALEDLLPE